MKTFAVGAVLARLLLCKENAVVLILCRNSDLKDIAASIASFEDVFNRKFGYPYVFLNDDDFTDDFKRGVEKAISTTAKFGKLKQSEWGYPPWIDQARATEAMAKLDRDGVIYGGMLSYHHMCRFFSGFFYKNDLVKDYDFYWRIEPGVKFFCSVDYDPFALLREKNKKYGFVIAIREFMETIPTLWESTMEFVALNRAKMPKNTLSFILNGTNYNGCHFWSNFEIASFDFYRSDLYERYFEHLDRKGGFFYERWGDAPVHSLAAALFLGKDKVHFFNDIGYEHPPIKHCPATGTCTCSPSESIDNSPFSCLNDVLPEIKDFL